MTNKFTDDELAKLPQWAQRRVNGLQQDLDSLQVTLSKINAGDTHIYYELSAVDRARVYLPDFANIHFVTATGTIEAGIVRDKLQIYANGIPIIVRPISSNVITIEGN